MQCICLKTGRSVKDLSFLSTSGWEWNLGGGRDPNLIDSVCLKILFSIVLSKGAPVIDV